jgi:hypothetical protein
MREDHREAEPGIDALARLERRLDAWPYRLAARVAERARSARKHSALPGRTREAEPVVAELRTLLQAGALESAVITAELLARGPVASSPRGITLLAQTWLMCGERARAMELVKRHRQALRGTDAGVTQLELLGLGDDEIWLPSGRPNTLAIGRRLREGTLDAEGLTRSLQARPLSWLKNPELFLLLHSALLSQEPARALGFFNRFLAVHGLRALSGVSAAGPDVSWLAGLRSARLPRESGPPLTVVVAVRNAATTIDYALESLLAQSYEPLEILVCDDASDDETPRLLAARRDPRIRAFRSLRRQGAYNVRNCLLAQARGSLLTFHDADDFALPERMSRQVRSLARSGAVACLANWVRLTQRGDPVFFKDMKAARLSRVSLMLKREAFATIGPFRPVEVGGDAELQSALQARFGRRGIVRLSAPLMLSAWSPSSATRALGTEALEDGYQSVLRRGYAELIFRQRSGSQTPISEREVLDRLRELGNLVEPSKIVPL